MRHLQELKGLVLNLMGLLDSIGNGVEGRSLSRVFTAILILSYVYMCEIDAAVYHIRPGDISKD